MCYFRSHRETASPLFLSRATELNFLNDRIIEDSWIDEKNLQHLFILSLIILCVEIVFNYISLFISQIDIIVKSRFLESWLRPEAQHSNHVSSA